MRPSPSLAKGFLSRSVDELKRLSHIAVNLEAVKGPQGPRPLYAFDSPSSTSSCIIMSDKLIGGQSTSHLDYITPSSSNPRPHARFHGQISTALPPSLPNIKRTGYAAFRTPDQHPTLFGRSFWDIDPYTYLALRIKSDARSYFLNLQTESVEPTDLHQHRLFSKRPGEWETVLVRWNDFVRTNYGFVVEPQGEMLRQKVKTWGVGVTDRVEGQFELCIESVWATNDESEGEVLGGGLGSDEGEGGGGLKSRKGESVKW